MGINPAGLPTSVFILVHISHAFTLDAMYVSIPARQCAV